MKKTARLLKGKEIAEDLIGGLSRPIEGIRKSGAPLCLAMLQAGAPRDVVLYAKSLGALLNRLHVEQISRVFPEGVSEETLLDEIEALNADENVTGIMVFSPLPASLNAVSVLNAIHFLKDVEGRRVQRGVNGRILSPTASAVLALIEKTGCEIAGKEAVVIGHSDLVGKPAAILLLDRMATVTVCHLGTRSLREHVSRADIVVAAAGKACLVKGDWIKEGAIVIDVGENHVAGELVGDVEFEAACERASFISPVPGGVGPLTNVMLVRNLLRLHELQRAT
ncbi:MAG: bifunctional 5,10-methylenetetrahydrofolate dehydrogenase/5,10-methenyltetrahydrofolate cyclohydrolase [Candidatus Omnitrophica bacterium]|nr:bifunctional 5,10-methylenetetrahydrofolate dehydrogenase/5,10-methenyltetrahydrofolate cyclohydrolase [Candidatus Omnitrophota bacterium]